MIFYTAVAVVCIVGFTADMILRYMMKIPSFGMEGRLHNIKGKLIPIEDFIPHNLTMLFVFGAALGIFGIFMKLLDINGLIAFPCSVMFGCGVNFLVMHIIKPFFTAISGDVLSEKTDISGYEATCTEKITPEGYGSVTVVYEKRSYDFNAVSVNGSVIEKGERVYILYREDGLCFVEKTSEVTDIINEKE